MYFHINLGSLVFQRLGFTGKALLSHFMIFYENIISIFFGTMLQRCLAVMLPMCFVDYKVSLNFLTVLGVSRY